MKQSKPHRHLNELYIEAFEHNVSICVVHVLNEYLNRTKDIQSGPELFITTQSPFKAASKSTIATWIKIGLRMAGIDMDMLLHIAQEVHQQVRWLPKYRLTQL